MTLKLQVFLRKKNSMIVKKRLDNTPPPYFWTRKGLVLAAPDETRLLDTL